MKVGDIEKFKEIIIEHLKDEGYIEDLSDINVAEKKKTIPVTGLGLCSIQTSFKIHFSSKTIPNKSMVAGMKLHEGLGKIIENHWKDIIEQIPYLEDAEYEMEKTLELPLKNGWKLTGRADLVAGNMIFEFKFKNSKGFESFGDDEDIGTILAVEQLNAYLHMLKGSHSGIIWTFNIDEFSNLGKSKSIKHKIVEKDDYTWKETLRKAEFVAQILEELEKGKMPTKEIIEEKKRLNKSRIGWICNYCQYRFICRYVEMRTLRENY